MAQEKPHRGHAAGRGSSSEIKPADSRPAPNKKQPCTAPTPTVDLVGLRARLVGARRRLVERIAEDFPADRRFPDSGWTRMLADIHITIMAVDDMIAEAGP